MRIFLTGGTGFIGGRVAEMLRERGDEVVALSRSPEKEGRLREMGAEIARGDITERESMREPMRAVDAVLHVAAWYRTGALRKDRETAERINVDGTRNVLELMRELEIPKGVYTSTVAVFSDTKGEVVREGYRHEGRHITLYDETKARAQHAVAEPMMEAGLPLVILQPGMVYGPGDTGPMADTFRLWLRRRLPAIPRSTVFCWSHVDDVARIHIDALVRGRPGESYIVTGPAHSMAEAFEIAGEVAGRRPPPIRIPAAVQKGMALGSRLVEWALPLPEQYRSEALRTSAGTTYLGDPGKARGELGWSPRPLREGFGETIPAWMEEVGAG